MAEHPKSKSTGGCYHPEWPPCILNILALLTAGVDGVAGVHRAARRRGGGRRRRQRREAASCAAASSGADAGSAALLEAAVVPADDGLDGHRVGVAVRYLDICSCDSHPTRSMRQVPLERDINIAVNGPLLVGNLH